MEYTISIYHEDRYVEVRTRGTASTRGFLAFAAELLEPAIAELNFDLLVDFSLLDTSPLGFDDIRAVELNRFAVTKNQ